MLKKLKKYIENPKFTPENVEKVSKVSKEVYSYRHFLAEKNHRPCRLLPRLSKSP